MNPLNIAAIAAAALMLAACGDASPEAPTATPSPSDSAVAAPVVDERPLEEQFGEAIGQGDVAYIEALVDSGLDVNANLNPVGSKTYALQLAQVTGQLGVVQVIVDSGYDLEAQNAGTGRTILIAAAQDGDLQFIDALLEAGADIEGGDLDDDNTPFHYALYFDQVEAAQFLLERGADPGHVDRRGRNSADIAAQGGSVEAQEFVALLGIVATGA